MAPRVLIVGAGIGGIAQAIELRKHGFSEVTILEGAPEGGAASGSRWSGPAPARCSSSRRSPRRSRR